MLTFKCASDRIAKLPQSTTTQAHNHLAKFKKYKPNVIANAPEYGETETNISESFKERRVRSVLVRNFPIAITVLIAGEVYVVVKAHCEIITWFTNEV